MFLFKLGDLVETDGVQQKYEGWEDFYWFLFDRLGEYLHGNFGCVDKECKKANIKAIVKGETVYGKYKFGDDTIWIKTELSKGVTTILLPEEFEVMI